MPPQTFSTPQDQAKAHNSSPRTMERWRADGTGPPFMKIAGKILYWPVGSEPYNDWACKRTVFSIAEAEANEERQRVIAEAKDEEARKHDAGLKRRAYAPSASTTSP